MKSDEERHGNSANKSGAKEVPPQLKKIMGITANIMKFASYRL
jgi:demethoxyubiquinone hydroxylase (CLK1/Coq7/Cat5 family)